MLLAKLQKPLHGSQGNITLDVKLSIDKGAFIVLMGESGAGKSTLLRILAGLDEALGKIEMNGKIWLDIKEKLAPQYRKIGFVFQDYALFENMSVEENLLFVNKDKDFAEKLLRLTELTGLSARNVNTLSGGQKQRLSLCRAMMHQPQLLLMDEPLSALDAKMRYTLQGVIAKFHKTFGTTTIMISHDADVANALADRIIVMEQGKIVKEGIPEEVLKKSIQTVYEL